MKIEDIELVLIAGIVLIQLWVFGKTFFQIRLLRYVFPPINSMYIEILQIPKSHLKNYHPTTILENIEKYKQVVGQEFTNEEQDSNFETNLFSASNEELNKEIEHKSHELVSISLIRTEKSKNKVFSQILDSLNKYLIRNSGASSDFSLMKDIIERSNDAMDEDINISIAIPLYLGLAGTMLGIIIGLFSMPDLSIVVDLKTKDLLLNEGITTLIGGVKVAMIASFVGLIMTVTNSGWVYKGAKSQNESKKNDLYTFLQVELLPIVNQGVAATFDSLQRNLVKFNDEFSYNLKKLDGVFDSNIRAIESQKELLDTLEKAKVSQIAKYNIQVLKQLDDSVVHFKKFNSYLSNINQMVDNSNQMVIRTGELLDRTSSVQSVSENIEFKLDQGQKLLDFISAHFRNLENIENLTKQSVVDVSNSISNVFEELKKHIESSSDNVRQFTVDELALIKNALSASSTNLSNLDYLALISESINETNKVSETNTKLLSNQLEKLNQITEKSINLLEKIEKNQSRNTFQKIGERIKRLF